MWVSLVEFHNIKSFDVTGSIDLSKTVNILLGANNSGKSTIIRVLYLLQQRGLSVNDIRIGKSILALGI